MNATEVTNKILFEDALANLNASIQALDQFNRSHSTYEENSTILKEQLRELRIDYMEQYDAWPY